MVGGRGVAVLGAVWVREGCGWGEGGEGGEGRWRGWSCWGSNRALFFIFLKNVLISGKKGRFVGGEGGGHGSMWAWGGGCSGGGVGSVGGVGSEGTVGGRGGGCAGGGVGACEGCGWAVGAVSAVGAGGAGGRVGAAILGGASSFFGGKADMWAARAVGMEAWWV